MEPDAPPVLRDGQITQLTPQKRRPDRMSVFINGAFAFGIHQDIALLHGLHAGLSLTVAQQEAIIAAEHLQAAKATALHYLSYRPRTCDEVRQKLRKGGYEDEIIAQVLERVQTLGYIDDASYARRYAQERLQHRGYGPRRIAVELRRKGVDRGLIEAALAGTEAAESTVEIARGLAEKRWRVLAREPDLRKRRKKLADYLLRRGFNHQTVFELVDSVARDSANY